MNKELAEKKRKRKPQSSIEEILLLVDGVHVRNHIISRILYHRQVTSNKWCNILSNIQLMIY